MRVAVAHNTADDSDGPDAKDVLVQVECVRDALEALGHHIETIACSLDLDRFQRAVSSLSAHVVFNLVESLAGTGRLIHLAPFVLDAMGISYTGSSAESILLTSNKVMAKQHMLAQGLPTPAWVGPFPESGVGASCVKDGGEADHTWIIKSVWEHASIGLDETGIVRVKNNDDLMDLLRVRAAGLGGDCFAERFVDGREFNLSLLGGGNGPTVLPPAEIIFEGYDEKKPRIVDYQAKWDDTSFAFHHTPRRFDFEPQDGTLLEVLKGLAKTCWNVFALKGYARVDFRVDSSGQPWILEINTNPCLSPDAGFAAALQQSGIPFVEAVHRILDDIPGRSVDRFFFKRPVETSAGGRYHAAEKALREIDFRSELNTQDPERIRRLVEVTGFFSDDEVDVAEELANERLTKGLESGYYFLLAQHHDGLIGYTCYGPIPCTCDSYDLYWIAVHPDFHRRGIGRLLVEKTEGLIRAAGGSRVYVDTSQRLQYGSTRAFYERCGYRLETVLTDFYAPGDGKAIYCKVLI